MNKLFKHLSGIVLGLTMAVGVGAAISVSNKASEAGAVDLTFVKGSTSYDNNTINGHSCVKIGSGSAGGDCTLVVPNGTTEISFYAAGWNGDTATFTITGEGVTVTPSTITAVCDSNLSGSGNSFTLAQAESTYLKTIELSGVTSEKTLTFASSAKKRRIFFWGATTGGGPTPCTHENYTSTSAVAATCTTDGNSAYVHCSDCNKYFEDNTFVKEITVDSWIIPALGHSWVYDPIDDIDRCERQGCGATKPHDNTATFNPETCTNMTGTAGEQTQTINGVTVEISQGLVSESLRIYKSQTLTITSTGTINRIEFDCIEEGQTKYGPGCLTVDCGTYTYDSYYGTWEGSSNSVIFTATNDQCRAEEIIVYFSPSPVDVWCNNFIKTVTCDNGVTEPSLSAWATMKNSYNELESTDKATLISYNHAGLDRYDYIIGKYGADKYENFIGRSVVSATAPSIISNLVNDNAINFVVIITISLASLTAIGGYFYIRRRKEN